MFEKEVQYFYKYWEGPKNLPNVDFMLSAQSNENDLHLAVFVKDLSS